jgi:Viral BACON domain/Divergent InlB B-repeat domain
MRGRSSAWMGATFALTLLSACVDGTPAGPASFARFAIEPSFALQATEPLDFSSLDRIVARVIRPPSTILAETSVSIPPGNDPIVIDLDVELAASSEELRVEVEMWAGDVLAFSGSRTGRVSAGGDVPVLRVDVERRIPEVRVFPDRLQFQAIAGRTEPDPEDLEVRNEGPGSVEWSASADVEWLELSPAGGALAEGERAKVRVRARPGALTAGSHLGSIVVSAPGALGAPANVAVSLELEEPPVELFGLRVEADGDGSGSGKVVSSPEGIDCAIDRASSSGSCESDFPAGTRVTLTALPSDGHRLDRWTGDCGGSGSCAVEMSDDRRVGVAFAPPPPALRVEPSELGFKAEGGADPDVPEASFTVANDGGGVLDWTAVVDAPWVEVSPADGSVEVGRPATVRVKVASRELAAGSHRAIVTVRGGGGSAEVSVTVEVSRPAELRVATDTIRFAAVQGKDPAPDTASVKLTNVGDAPLDWRAKVGGSWLLLGSREGSLGGGASALLRLRATATQLNPGVYRESIEVTAGDAGQAVIPVVLVVTSGGY